MVAKSNDQHEPSAHKWLNITRRAAIVLLVVISGLAFGTYVAVRWTEKQVLNTDNWVSLVTPLPKQPVVYNALGSYIGNKVYPADTVKTELTNALPPKASFLATPLTSQLQSITVKVAQKVVSSDAFQTVWSGANRVAMDRLLSKARGQPTALQQKLGEKFNLNLSNVTSQLGPALGSLSSVIPALQPNSQKVIDVSTNLHASAEKVRQVVRTIDFTAAVLPTLIIASVLWALALAKHKRRTLMSIALFFIVVLLAELVAIKGGRDAVLNQVQNSSNIPAGSYIYDTLLAELKNMIVLAILIMAVIYLICILSGPSRVAVAFRRLIRLDKWHLGTPLGWWQTARLWVTEHRLYLMVGTIIGVLAVLAAFITINARSVTNSLLLLASILAVYQLMTLHRPNKAKAKTKAT